MNDKLKAIALDILEKYENECLEYMSEHRSPQLCFTALQVEVAEWKKRIEEAAGVA